MKQLCCVWFCIFEQQALRFREPGAVPFGGSLSLSGHSFFLGTAKATCDLVHAA